jgi:predicted class III extradiol MEMO1 family dioxygenase
MDVVRVPELLEEIGLGEEKSTTRAPNHVLRTQLPFIQHIFDAVHSETWTRCGMGDDMTS